MFAAFCAANTARFTAGGGAARCDFQQRAFRRTGARRPGTGVPCRLDAWLLRGSRRGCAAGRAGHSDTEDRFIAIGPISRGVVLVVWVDRDDETIRIVSARFATRRERRLFEEHLDRLP